MNPFNWDGPSFLVFYASLAAVILAFLWLWSRRGPRVSGVRISKFTSEPYKIACLRGGESELIRVAVFNLADRRFLEFRGPMIARTRTVPEDLLTRPIDRAIVAMCSNEPSLREIVRNAAVRKHAAAYAKELSDAGLLANQGERNARMMLILAAVGLLAGVALAKIVIALARGHHNIIFLIMSAVVACGLTVFMGYRVTTGGGAAVLGDLKTLTARLKRNAPSLRMGAGTNDALLLAAVHGFAVLPESFYFLRPHFLPPKAGTGSGGDSSGCGSSCGSSGCGGGGGCGGCGS